MENEKSGKNGKKETVLTWVIAIGVFIAAGVMYWFGFEEIVAVIIIFGFIGLIIFVFITNQNYMRKQKADNTDKKKLLDLMAEVMGNQYGNYTYVTGFYERTEYLSNRRTRTWFYSYVLAFNQTDMVILPFVVKDGQVLLRNRMAVNWNEFTLKYHLYNDDINLDFVLGGEQITMYIRKVIKSGGVEKSSKPLAVFQEQETALLKSYLPGYPNAVKS